MSTSVFNGTGRLISPKLIPRAMEVLDSLSDATASLDRAIHATDRSVNGDLLPESKRLLSGTTDAVASARKSVDLASDQILQDGNDIHAILTAPTLKAILTETQGIASHAEGIAANLEEAPRQMPRIAAYVEGIAATSSPCRKLILLSQTLSALGRAFF